MANNVGIQAAGMEDLAGEADEFLRAEPGLGWLFTQVLYIAQPVLEAFWSGDQIVRLAESFEHTGRGRSGGAQTPGEDGHA
jgi:hypothetical protein